jgi:hypothetical protein
MKNRTKIGWSILKGRDGLECLILDWRLISKWILIKHGGMMEKDLFGTGQCLVATCCEGG